MITSCNGCGKLIEFPADLMDVEARRLIGWMHSIPTGDVQFDVIIPHKDHAHIHRFTTGTEVFKEIDPPQVATAYVYQRFHWPLPATDYFATGETNGNYH